jgi:glycosyl transferase family 1
MDEKHLHIVTHTVPWPVNYGGVIDLFYKIKSLSGAGIKIHLHCFCYGNQSPQKELNKYCTEVLYYKRRNDITGFSFRIPFIVSSRKCDALIKNLQKDNYPVLLEGIHCTYYLYKGALDNRKVFVRLHNAEFEYYRHLAMHEMNPVRKLYYTFESRLLKQYEKKIAEKAFIISVSKHDIDIYQQLFGAKNIHYLPVFIPYTLAICKGGNGCGCCLYHGNLSVNENEKAAEWLLKNVFNKLDVPFIIAGKDPTERLKYLVQQAENTCLVENPDEKEMRDLIAKAQINILPSFNNTGVKLKLLHALFNGKHCIVNNAAVEDSGLQDGCYIAEEPAEFRKLIGNLFKQPFSDDDIEQRQGLLETLYNNEANARQLIAWIW